MYVHDALFGIVIQFFNSLDNDYFVRNVLYEDGPI